MCLPTAVFFVVECRTLASFATVHADTAHVSSLNLTWIFSLSKKTDGRLSPLSPISVLQLGGSCLQICSLGSRGRQICSHYIIFEIRLGLSLGPVQGRKLERFTKSSKQWQGGILHSIRNLSTGVVLNYLHDKRKIPCRTMIDLIWANIIDRDEKNICWKSVI